MDDSLKQSWADFSSHYRNFFCPFCKDQNLSFNEPKQDKFAGMDVIAVTCRKCGHIELFDVNQVIRRANKILEDRHKPPMFL